MINPSVALTISFPSSTEKPVVTLAEGVNEYGHLGFFEANMHLQWPKELGSSIAPSVMSKYTRFSLDILDGAY